MFGLAETHKGGAVAGGVHLGCTMAGVCHLFPFLEMLNTLEEERQKTNRGIREDKGIITGTRPGYARDARISEASRDISLEGHSV